MKQADVFVGIDVAKARLDVALHPSGATWTVPNSEAGIAGLVLSIGMAVDANILIFERLKEELKAGKSLKAAVEEGFLRAWSSIRDGNVSTLITCGLLIWFGSSFVQGFAITLAIGILISMFSAITVTRILLRFVAPWFVAGRQWMFLGRDSALKEK